jgi:F-type H+-transporting ATPase subunit alpha
VPVEEQIVAIYAVTNGFLDDLEVVSVREWERQFIDWLRSSRPAVLEAIREKKELSDQVVTDLKAAIDAFKPMFQVAA